MAVQPAAALAAELARLHVILADALDRFRARRPDGTNGLGGLAVFDHEVDSFLESTPWQDAAEPRDMLDAAGAFARLAVMFDLSRAELDVVSIALAPELHAGYGRVYAYLQNDIGRTRPTASLVLDILAQCWADRLEIRAKLGPAGALARHQIIASSDELVLDEALVRFLLGVDPAQHLTALRHVDFGELILDEVVKRSLRDAMAMPRVLVCLRADPGTGKRTIAGALGGDAPVYLREFEPADREATEGAARVARWVRDVALAGGVPCFDLGSEPLEHAHLALTTIASALDRGQIARGIVLCESASAAALEGLGVATADIAVPAPRPTARRTAWERFVAAERLAIEPAELDSVAAVFALGIGKIRRAVRDAAARSQREPASITLLHQACRAQAHHRLDRLAERVTLVHRWDDLVLPADQLAQLREVADAVRHRARVLEEWAFGVRVAAAPGVNALFFGPSGTGKTMAAGVLAAELGMELYRVDLSRIVSKYIGETEKNLDALFDEARKAHALLFFDEADAIFGKRSEVKDAHDRYANIEVSFLLQRMESFEGIAILATNLRKNIDQAFMRRVQFAVEFPSPTVPQRLSIWKKIWPAEAELSPDLDLEFMATRFEWPGGNIRNIALKAAYLAATNREAISMRHLVAATRREFQKLGRLSVEQEFGPYSHLLPRAPIR